MIPSKHFRIFLKCGNKSKGDNVEALRLPPEDGFVKIVQVTMKRDPFDAM